MMVKLYSFKMEKREKKRLDKSLRESIEEIGLNPSRRPKPMRTVKLKAMKSKPLLLSIQIRSTARKGATHFPQ